MKTINSPKMMVLKSIIALGLFTEVSFAGQFGNGDLGKISDIISGKGNYMEQVDLSHLELKLKDVQKRRRALKKMLKVHTTPVSKIVDRLKQFGFHVYIHEDQKFNSRESNSYRSFNLEKVSGVMDNLVRFLTRYDLEQTPMSLMERTDFNGYGAIKVVKDKGLSFTRLRGTSKARKIKQFDTPFMLTTYDTRKSNNTNLSLVPGLYAQWLPDYKVVYSTTNKPLSSTRVIPSFMKALFELA